MVLTIAHLWDSVGVYEYSQGEQASDHGNKNKGKSVKSEDESLTVHLIFSADDSIFWTECTNVRCGVVKLGRSSDGE